MHGSAFDQMLTLYRYDGEQYSDMGCFEASWRVHEDGQETFLPDPRITACDSQ
jgi:hypothetical protein